MDKSYIERGHKALKERAETIRLRTLTLTGVLIVALVLYFLVSVTTGGEINWIDFIILSATTILMHYMYFPDGKLFGEKNPQFIQNRDAYNEKAGAVNDNKHIGKLREYCVIEWNRRKEQYIVNELGAIGITREEFEYFKTLDKKEILSMQKVELTTNGETRTLFFSPTKKKRLAKLLFKELPIEPNTPETIMSAVENSGYRAIKDKSIGYERRAHLKKFFMAIVIGGLSAYIGFKVKDGFSLATIVSIFSFLTSMFSTAVVSYTSGETTIRVYKNRFYLELCNFLDGFNEWVSSQPQTESEETPTEIKVINNETKGEMVATDTISTDQ